MTEPVLEPAPSVVDEQPPPHGRTMRLIVLAVLVFVIAVVLYGLFFTEMGREVRAHPHHAGIEFRKWVAAHPVRAPVILIGLYVLIALSLMPVWWLQILAGYGFGMWAGVGYSLIGAVLGALASFGAARTLLADYVHRRFEARHAKLRALDEKMGHNGLLVVMAARLTHVLPFGISNYLFGISRITFMDVLLGTLLGNAPMVTFYVAVGAGLHPEKNWKFTVTLAVINVLLLVPIVLRYWKPEWFKRIGVE